MRQTDASTSRARGGAWRVSLAFAAGIIVAVALYYRVNRPEPVSAAELLRKATAAAPAPDARRRIRMRTKSRSVVRPAVLPAGYAGGGDRGLELLFAAAHFSWQDPLSARSFAAWREQLPGKEDRVRTADSTYEIRTTTGAGVLREAVLILRAGDLQPVSETLRFADETVEISREDPSAEGRSEIRGGSERPSPAPNSHPPTPIQELRLIAALHAIGADLGEPVQVSRRDGVLVVEAVGLTSTREQQVRDAVSGIPGVIFRVDASEAMPMSAPGGRIAAAAGARSRLEETLGEEGVNRILDASEAVMARVFAIRGLSRRFPQTAEAQLADADRGVLAAIRSEHVIGLRTHVRNLQSALAPLLPKLPAVELPPSTDWQTRAARMFTAAQRVDHLLNRILAGGDDFAQRAPELAAALGRLDAEVNAGEGR